MGEQNNCITIESIKENLKCLQLLISASDEDSTELQRLLGEGADPNYIYEDGNTALHIAVQNCHDANVGNLIDQNADIYIENKSCRTPFDIAFANESILTQVDKRTRNNTIIEKLQEEIIQKSENKLSEFIKNREYVQSLNDEIESQESSTNGQDIDDIVEEHIKKKEDKIEACFKYLERANKDQNNNKISHTQANIFVYFLETFSFNDLSINKENPLKKEEKKINKKYQDHFVSKHEVFQKNSNLINELRTIFCHKSDVKISLKDVGKAIIGDSVSEFFVKLEKFVKSVIAKITGCDLDYRDCIDLSTILRQINEQDLTHYNKAYELYIGEFRNRIYKSYTWTPEEIQEILFNIIVNIAPAHAKRVDKLNELRNSLLHEFCTYENGKKMRDFAKAVFDLKSELLRYMYAEEVSKILREIKGIDTVVEIERKLSSALGAIQELKPNELYLSEEDTKYKYEYVLETTKPLYSNMEQYYIMELVRHYLIIMSAIDDELVENNNAVTYKIFDHNDRRKIFEKFMTLNRLKRFSPQWFNIEGKNFRKELLDDYGVTGVNFDKVCELLEDSNNSSQGNLNVEIINRIINDLIRLKNAYNFSYPYIISLYSRASKLKFKSYDLDKGLDIFEKVPEEKQRLFYDELKKLHKLESIKVTIDNKKMTVNLVKLVTNILKTFYLSYSSYPIKFNNIKEVFNDKIFLDYLVDCKNINSDRIIRKLLKINYTAPYILRLGKKNVLESVMDREDLKELTRKFLEEDDYVEHLNDLLKVAKVDNDLYEITWERVTTKNLENWRPILENERHVRNFFNKYLQNHEKKKSDKFVNDFMSQLNKVAHDLYQEGSSVSYQKALKLLDIFCTKESETYSLEILNARRIKARITNGHGQILQTKKKKKLAKGKHESSFNILKEIIMILENKHDKTFEDNMLYLLTLSHIAYTNMLLKDYENAYISYGTLFININKISIGQPLKIDVGAIDEERDEFENIIDIDGTVYNEVLSYSEEAKEYLNILETRKHMAFALCGSALKLRGENAEESIRLYQQALEIYKKVYRFQREHFKQLDSCTLKTMIRISFVSQNIAYSMDLLNRERMEQIYQIDLLVRNSVYALNIAIRIIERAKDNINVYCSIYFCLKSIACARKQFSKKMELQKIKRKIKDIIKLKSKGKGFNQKKKN